MLFGLFQKNGPKNQFIQCIQKGIKCALWTCQLTFGAILLGAQEDVILTWTCFLETQKISGAIHSRSAQVRYLRNCKRGEHRGAEVPRPSQKEMGSRRFQKPTATFSPLSPTAEDWLSAVMLKSPEADVQATF